MIRTQRTSLSLLSRHALQPYINRMAITAVVYSHPPHSPTIISSLPLTLTPNSPPPFPFLTMCAFQLSPLPASTPARASSQTVASATCPRTDVRSMMSIPGTLQMRECVWGLCHMSGSAAHCPKAARVAVACNVFEATAGGLPHCHGLQVACIAAKLTFSLLMASPS